MSFAFVRPEGWIRQDGPDGTVALVPPGPDAAKCSLFTPPGQNGELNDLVYHDTFDLPGSGGPPPRPRHLPRRAEPGTVPLRDLFRATTGGTRGPGVR